MVNLYTKAGNQGNAMYYKYAIYPILANRISFCINMDNKKSATSYKKTFRRFAAYFTPPSPVPRYPTAQPFSKNKKSTQLC